MPPQRKKAKTSYAVPDTQVPVTDPALHPDLAAASTLPTLKMDPDVLHPDLAAASTQIQPPQFSIENVSVPPPTPPQPKQRKNAAAASRAAAAVAAQLQQQQQQQQQQLQHQQIGRAH